MLIDTFTAEGYWVASAESQASARATLQHQHFDIVLLDLILGDGNGADLLPDCRRFGPTGVIILSICSERDDRLSGLGQGADDYVVKPFDIDELLLRVRNLALRSAGMGWPQAEGSATPATCRFGQWRLEFAKRRLVHQSGQIQALTRSEFQLLCALIAHRGMVADRPTLLLSIGHTAAGSKDRAVDGLILRLRHKLGDEADAKRYIRSHRGIGYQFVMPVTWDRDGTADGPPTQSSGGSTRRVTVPAIL